VSCHFCSLFADQVLKRATEQVTEENHTGTFDYADDIDLVVCSASELQESMDFWCAILTDNDLKLNTSKLDVKGVRGTACTFTRTDS